MPSVATGMLGQLLGGRYRVINVLGSGGFGHTYIAEDTQRPGNPRCVLKHLTFASANTVMLEQVRRLFQAEAETLEKLGKHDQIPQLLAYFEQDREFYLVQEFIQGRSLSDELADTPRLTEPQVATLLEDVLSILEYVHSQNVIHRDIKPENLICRDVDRKFVLIDFGAVKTIGNTVAETAGETSLSVPIYTSGYGASEQCLGRPRFSSDLYSLGMVAIQALTGMRPAQLPQDFNTSEVIWRDQAVVSERLADFIDRMVRYHFMHRYQSATEALQDLHQIISHAPTVMTHPTRPSFQGGATVIPSTDTQPQAAMAMVSPAQPRSKLLKPLAIGGAVLTVLLAGAGWLYSQRSQDNPLSTPPAIEAGQNITPQLTTAQVEARTSEGERLLNQWRTSGKKQEGIEKLAAGDYSGAVAELQAAWQTDRDPETLIYLNNARIGTNRAYKIAVAIPLGDQSLNSALEILRGVAQAQDEVNRAGGINQVPLKVKLVNDSNDRTIARELAKSLVADPTVLGVVGHGISDTTLAAAEVYQASQLVMVAPVSSAVQLSKMGNYIFRTMPSDQLTAQALANYMLQHLKKRKVAIFFNSASDYSQSLKTEFKNALLYKSALEPLAEVDLARPDFDAYASVNQAIGKGAEVILLAADHTTADKAIQVAFVNNGRLKLMSGDSMYTPKLLQVAQVKAAGLVMAVPVDLTQSPFQPKYNSLWGATAPLTWRTALAYDATQALISALRRDQSRPGVQDALSQPGFATVGATGQVQFVPQTGDRKTNVRLITVAPVKSGNTTTYRFKSLPF